MSTALLVVLVGALAVGGYYVVTRPPSARAAPPSNPYPSTDPRFYYNPPSPGPDNTDADWRTGTQTFGQVSSAIGTIIGKTA